jgi:glycosyltransferase involved in cell wall biosynthesis
MIRALASLKQEGVKCYLILAGGGEDLSRLQALAGELGVSELVFFLGYLPRGAQLAHVANSDIVITHLAQPRFEGISQVHLEATLLKKPIITMVNKDLEVLKENLFMVRAPDHEEVASRIRHVLEHPREARKRANQGARIVEETFSWAQVVHCYLETYSNIAYARGDPPDHLMHTNITSGT